MSLGLEDLGRRKNIGMITPSNRDSKQPKDETSVGRRIAKDENISDHYRREMLENR